ncbi:MAG: glycosyltransferase family 39 protein [Deltaproteobacteria bacterium]|nr:glycosyltransferase family 39 protein [Deltaproteobacteria bacterium]
MIVKILFLSFSLLFASQSLGRETEAVLTEESGRFFSLLFSDHIKEDLERQGYEWESISVEKDRVVFNLVHKAKNSVIVIFLRHPDFEYEWSEGNQVPKDDSLMLWLSTTINGLREKEGAALWHETSKGEDGGISVVFWLFVSLWLIFAVFAAAGAMRAIKSEKRDIYIAAVLFICSYTLRFIVKTGGPGDLWMTFGDAFKPVSQFIYDPHYGSAPVVLAKMLFTVFPADTDTIVQLNIILGSLSPAIIFLLAANLGFNRAASALAGVFAATFPLLVRFSGTTAREPILLFLMLACIVEFIEFRENRGIRSLVSASAACLLALHTRPEGAFTLLFLLAAFMGKPGFILEMNIKTIAISAVAILAVAMRLVDFLNMNEYVGANRDIFFFDPKSAIWLNASLTPFPFIFLLLCGLYLRKAVFTKTVILCAAALFIITYAASFNKPGEVPVPAGENPVMFSSGIYSIVFISAFAIPIFLGRFSFLIRHLRWLHHPPAPQGAPLGDNFCSSPYFIRAERATARFAYKCRFACCLVSGFENLAVIVFSLIMSLVLAKVSFDLFPLPQLANARYHLAAVIPVSLIIAAGAQALIELPAMNKRALAGKILATLAVSAIAVSSALRIKETSSPSTVDYEFNFIKDSMKLLPGGCVIYYNYPFDSFDLGLRPPHLQMISENQPEWREWKRRGESGKCGIYYRTASCSARRTNFTDREKFESFRNDCLNAAEKTEDSPIVEMNIPGRRFAGDIYEGEQVKIGFYRIDSAYFRF